MIEILRNDQDTVHFKIRGTIEGEDYKKIVPILEEKIDNFGGFNLVGDIDEVTGITASGIWEDLKFDVKHFRSTKKMAIISGKDKIWLGPLSEPFVSQEVKVFRPHSGAEAWEWARSN